MIGAVHGHGKWRPNAKPWFMASSCSKRLTPMRICSCPSQHRSTLKEVLPSEPSRTTVRGTNKNNKAMVQSTTLCERTWVPRATMPTWFLNRSFFFIVLFLELCVVTITAIPHERGQQRTNAPIAARAEIHDTKLVQVPTD